MRSPTTSAALVTALAAGVACTGGASGDAVPGDAAAPAVPPVRSAPMAMGMMPVDSAMVMLHGFCAVQNGPESAGAAEVPRRVELIVGGDATTRSTRITVVVTAAAAPGLAADLTAGSDAHAMCAGPGRSIIIGGTAMFIGRPTLTLTSDGPVTVLARTVQAETLAGPVEVRAGGAPAVLAWGPTARLPRPAAPRASRPTE